MKSYLAHDKTSGQVCGGGRSACLRWAVQHCQQHPKSVVNILLCRPKSPARVIAEIDASGGRWVFGGRTLNGKQLQDLVGRAAHDEVQNV